MTKSSEKRPLTIQETHYLAMNIVGNAIKTELEWEFLLVNSQMEKNPQFVCIDKEKRKHFIIVRAIISDDNPDFFDASFMQNIKKHAETFQAKTYWAGVGLTNFNTPNAPLIYGEPYQITFNGLLEIK